MRIFSRSSWSVFILESTAFADSAFALVPHASERLDVIPIRSVGRVVIARLLQGLYAFSQIVNLSQRIR